MSAPTTTGSNPQNATQNLPATITLQATIRDFIPKKQDAVNGHPDFEMDPRPAERTRFPNSSGFGLVTGIVQTTLVDGKPAYSGATTLWNNGKAAFDRWFSNDHPSTATRSGYTLTLKKTAQNTYVLDSAVDEPFKSRGGFFPIDGELLGNFANSGHNFHFTLETHTEFTYQRGQTFEFRGDDDLWVYINGKLVIDLGGVHEALTQKVNLDTLGLTEGQTYPLDLFYAERRTTKANFRVETSIVLRPAIAANIEATKPEAHKIGPVPGEFTITLDQVAPAGGVVVNYGINEVAPPTPLTASVEGTDFTLQPTGRSVTVPAGSSSVTIQVNPQGTPPLGDSSGVVVANLKPGTGYRVCKAVDVVKISDQVLLNASIVAAGDANKVTQQAGAFKIQLDQDAPNGLVVNYEIVPGGADAAAQGVDFEPLSGSVTFPGGKEVTIPVTPKATLGVNATKPLTLKLKSGTNYQPSPTPATINILDQAPVLLNAAIAPAGDARKVGLVPGAFKVTLDKPAPASGLTVNYAIVPGAANAAVSGTDFTALSGSVVVPPNLQEVSIPVVPTATRGISETKPLTVKLQAGTGYTPSATPAMINIIDVAVPLNAAIARVADARKVGSVQGAFKVTLDKAAPAGGLTVNYAIVPGPANAAISGTDFAALSGSVVVPANHQEVSIPVVPAATRGISETKPLTLKLQPGTGYTPSATSATINIIDEAVRVVLPTVSIRAGGDAWRPVPAEPARPPRPARPEIPVVNSSFTITCTDKRADQSLVVTFSLAGEAQLGTDFDLSNNVQPPSVTIPAGQTSVTLPVNPRVAVRFRNKDLVVVAQLQDAPGSYTVATRSASLTIKVRNPDPA
ncbi:fibro-slime domain-containing protein [Kovacikia minuta CCNUW1]|uniref:fibro-slime domain-containing protein n=1 Tax=Kovacikia minuta TaxID=2931930 RepID=UPI001CCD7E8F|nr:fibro-slime domain-containing protein [Kovacikia minuta]UBF26501.1 fibro-slime domain-containing protein [Kovacikia minuta CCNUW1]